ncbi:MAG: NAD(P)(+) transhydrogenase (Re/Si-specific) subunit beta [Candidatus Porifericomitaceae bacterium WSBS_2022_MAG_OTU9]
MQITLDIVYFLAAVLFIVSLRQMSSPLTARKGIMWGGVGMAAAFLVTLPALFYINGMPMSPNAILLGLAVLLGGTVALVSARKVAMTDMPQMIAIYNGMGGGAAACISILELLPSAGQHGVVVTILAVLGALIGLVSFSGSGIAFLKLQGWLNISRLFPGQQYVNFALLAVVSVLAVLLMLGHGSDSAVLLLSFTALALLYGLLMTIPIGGADMPVVISLYNALTGLAVAFEGYVLHNPALIIAGTVVGAAGTLLTQLMAKSMNRSIWNVLFSGFGSEQQSGVAVEGEMKETSATDAGVLMAFAERVIIVPGYGMAVAQAQHKIKELTQLLENAGVRVEFAIHPVAGRMPGHMNVLLAEAGVPYDKLADLEDINSSFPVTDVALVIGANDVVNPAARTDTGSPIYGMPILDVDRAKNCIVIKRGKGKGFSGIENMLFFSDNTRMLYGDAQKAISELIQEVKALR